VAVAGDGGAMTLATSLSTSRNGFRRSGSISKGVRIQELPPNGQGLAALIALGILDRCDLDGLDADGAKLQHLAIEAAKLGMADAVAHIADPSAMRVSAETLLADGYLCERAGLVRRDQRPSAGPRQITSGRDGLSPCRRRRGHDGLLLPVELSRLRLGNRRAELRRTAQAPVQHHQSRLRDCRRGDGSRRPLASALTR
jgi:hypothetical protein